MLRILSVCPLGAVVRRCSLGGTRAGSTNAEAVSMRLLAYNQEAYLREGLVDKHVQYATKQLVTHEYRKEQVAQDECAGVSPGICPDVQGSKQETNTVDCGHEEEEFPVGPAVR